METPTTMRDLRVFQQTRAVSRHSDKNLSHWLTTGDAARMLGVTADGVRWLARNQRLACLRTHSGQWLFRQSDVLHLVEQRAKARICSRPAMLRAVRPQMLRARLEPRQLSLFRPRLVAPRAESERSLMDPGVKASDLFRKRA